MSPETEATPQPFDLDGVADTALQLAAQRDLASAVRLFLETLRSWTRPSAVLAAVSDPAGGGWRLMPELCHGSASLGAERWIAKLVEETPDCLARTTVLAGQEVAGARVRDNWVVPWRCGGETGLLLLRGVPRPQPANLGQALALVAAPLWPRLLGGPAERVETLVRELQSAAQRLEVEASRQVERLQALQTVSGEATESAIDAAETHAAAAEAELATARQELRSRSDEMQQERAGAALREEEQRGALAAAEARVAAAEQELAQLRSRQEAPTEAEAVERALAAERALTAAQDALASAQQQRALLEQDLAERDQARDGAEQAAAAAAQRVAALQDAVAAAEAARSEALQAALAADQAREKAEHERVQAEEAAAATAQQSRELIAARAEDLDRRLAAEQQLASVQQELENAQQQLASAQQELAGNRQELARSQQEATSTRQELENSRRELAAARKDLQGTGDARQELAAGREQLALVLQELAGARQERDDTAEAAVLARSQAEEAQRALNETAAKLAGAEEARAEAVAAQAAVRQALDAERLELQRIERELEEARGERASLVQALESARGQAELLARGHADNEARVVGVAAAARETLETARRAAFVPAGLRLALDDLTSALGPEPERASPRVRIAILDRDLGGLGPLAAELEAAGVDVRIANYAEELGLLLKTPAGRDVIAAVCDVMAFRPEQNVASLLHGWERDRPGLAFFLSSATDSAVEVERMRRVPPAFIAWQFGRPLSAARLLEAVEVVVRRTAKS